MLFFDGGAALIFVVVWILCFIDVLFHEESEVRSLPKLAWVFIVLLGFEIGAIAWLIFGHNWDKGRTRSGATRNSLFSSGSASKSTRSAYPEYDSPGRYVPANPDDDEAFLASLRARAEEQRRRGEEEKRKREAEGNS